MENTLLLVTALPVLSAPLAYLLGKKSPKTAAFLISSICLIEIALLSTIVPQVLSSPDHKYVESYSWIPAIYASLTFFADGISLSMAITTLVLIFAATIFSINYMQGKRGLAEYYALLALLSAGLVGVFITSNLMLFYFCWELMLVPSYFIIGEWGYRDPYRAAFKFFIFTHAGAIFVLLGIGAIFMLTGNLDIFSAQTALMNAPSDLVMWVLLSLTLGFAVKMAVVPFHMWLPDAHSEAPAPMSALLSGVIISAGAYAILRISLWAVLPATLVASFGDQFLHSLAILGVISAFFGSLIALVENDVKRIIAYSSISHMGYVLFGLSMFPCVEAIIGAVLHLVNHAMSKGLFFLSAGSLMRQLEIRDIREMGGLANKMPITAIAGSTAALSIAGMPVFACFISEFIMFIGAFKVIGDDGFYVLPTILMLIATVLSLAYALRYITRIFLGRAKTGEVKEAPLLMRVAMLILVAIVISLGIWPSFLVELIATAILPP